MTSERRGRNFAVAAALISIVMAVVYPWIMMQQDDTPVTWILGGLILAGLLAVYGAAPVASHPVAALTTSGCILVVLGFLGILTIGLPILVAGLLAFVAADRSRPATHT